MFSCTSGVRAFEKERGRPPIVRSEEIRPLVTGGLSHRHHPPWILFHFSLLTRTLSLNNPAAVLIVWILGRKQWRGYCIKRVGEDVASAG